MSIHLRGVVHLYGRGASAVAALNGLHLDVADAEVCIVRGPNGSGKTTLIGVLTGALTPSAGVVQIAAADEAKPRVAVVRQFDDLVPELTVFEHFSLFGNAAPEVVPLDWRDRRIAELTRTQRRIVSTALALSTDPDVLLADEPTGSLSDDDAMNVYALLQRESRERGVTLLLVTHDVRAEHIADRVVRLDDGRISEQWTPGQLPQQVVDARGWLRIPDAVLHGLTATVRVQASSVGAELLGRQSNPTAPRAVPRQRRLGPDAAVVLSHVVADVDMPPLSGSVLQGSLTVISGTQHASPMLHVIAGVRACTSGTLVHAADSSVAYFAAETPFGSQLSPRELGIETPLLDALRLRDFAHRPLHTLSGGQRQRTIIGLALQHDASVILLDDPSSSLDAESTDLVLDAISHSSKTIIAASQDPRFIAAADQHLAL